MSNRQTYSTTFSSLRRVTFPYILSQPSSQFCVLCSPLHECKRCGEGGGQPGTLSELVTCPVCPKAFHVRCMPGELGDEHSLPRRVWLAKRDEAGAISASISCSYAVWCMQRHSFVSMQLHVTTGLLVSAWHAWQTGCRRHTRDYAFACSTECTCWFFNRRSAAGFGGGAVGHLLQQAPLHAQLRRPARHRAAFLGHAAALLALQVLAIMSAAPKKAILHISV